MKPWLRRIALAIAFLGAVPAPGLLAQKKNQDSTTRSVQGIVSDSAGAPVAGAVVQLKNTKSLQIRSFITKEQGEYFFNSLSPDIDYEVHAAFNGASSSTKTLSSFNTKQQAVLNLKLDK